MHEAAGHAMAMQWALLTTRCTRLRLLHALIEAAPSSAASVLLVAVDLQVGGEGECELRLWGRCAPGRETAVAERGRAVSAAYHGSGGHRRARGESTGGGEEARIEGATHASKQSGTGRGCPRSCIL